MKIKSKILGISYTGNHYSVVLEDMTNNKVKLPIIISDKVALDISEINNDNYTGDETLIGNLISNSDIKVNDIYINEINNGIFKVKVTLDNNKSFNSSVSDALLLSYITKCDIFISDEVLKLCGVKLKEDDSVDYTEINYDDSEGVREKTSLEELNEKLALAISEERYEDAAEIQKMIENNNNDNNNNLID